MGLSICCQGCRLGWCGVGQVAARDTTGSGQHRLRICIHRGTREIGGTCVEVEAQGRRLVLDIGLPLTADDPESTPLHPVRGFAEPDPSLLGVFISHPHPDHYGLAHRLPQSTPFLIGPAARAILEAADLFTPAGLLLDRVTPLSDRKPISLGPFTITPYRVDHSAYDSYACLVEAEGKRVFYSGDFRGHGRTSALVDRLIADPPKDVDVLLIEGTTLGRPPGPPSSTEEDLVEPLRRAMNQTQGLTLVWASGQNIDRLVTLFKASRKAGRELVIDFYAAEILRATGNPRVPQADWSGVRVFLPASQRARIKQTGRFDLAERYRPQRVFPEELVEHPDRFVMLFRPSLMRDLDWMKGLAIGRLIVSVWSGYFRDPRNARLVAWLDKRSIPVDHVHTSGHADPETLERLAQVIDAGRIVPVHTDVPAVAQERFDRVVRIQDGVWLDV